MTQSANSAESQTPTPPVVSLIPAVLGFFVVTLDSFVVNVALPSIGQDLGGGMTGLQWVIDGYTLMFAAFLLSAGALCDRVGARRAFGIGVVIFVASSAACALSPSLGALILGRFAQGTGAAVMLPATLALIREVYHDEKKRGHAIALWAVGGAVASAAGPVVGGFLTLVSWRLIFVINVPTGILVLVLLTRGPRSPRRQAPFDWIGQAAAILGMGGLTYGLIEGGSQGFGTSQVILALAMALGALIVLVISQIRGTHPVVPPSLFRSREVLVSLSVGFAFVVGFYGLVFLFSLYFQQVRGLSASATGIAFVPMTVLSIFVNPVAARIAVRFGARVPMAIGQVLMAAGLLSLCILVATPDAPVLLLSLLTISVGLGSALSIPTMTALLVGSVPAELAGTASGVLNTFRQFGGAVAVAIFGALVANRDRFVAGMEISLVISVIVLVAAGCGVLTLRPQQIVNHREAP